MSEHVDELLDRARRLDFELRQTDEDPTLWGLLRVGSGAAVFGGTLSEIEGWLEAFEREQA